MYSVTLNPFRLVLVYSCLMTGIAIGGGGSQQAATSSLDAPGTLKEAVIRSLSLDPVVQKIRSEVTEARGFSREMRSDLLPQLRVEGAAGWANRDRSIDGLSTGGDDLFSRRVGLVFEQLIFDNGFHWYRWKDAEEQLKAKRLLDIAQRESTAFDTISAYLDVIRARKQVKLANANLDIHRKIKDLAKERAEAVGNQADVELSSARFSLAQTLLEERELALEQANTRFYRFVGAMPATLSAPSPARIASRDQVDATANWHYQAALHQREGALLGRKVVKSQYAPRLLFRGSGSVGEDVLGVEGRDNEASALVVIQWDIFDGWRRKGLMEQAVADIDRQNAVIGETLLALNQDIEARWADYASLAERIAILNRYAGELKKTVKLYEEQFELGTRPLLSMLDIQNEEIGASIRIVDELYEFDLATYRLLFFGGRLIKEVAGEQYLTTPRNAERAADSSDRHPWEAAASASPAEIPRAKKKRSFNPFRFFKKDKP